MVVGWQASRSLRSDLAAMTLLVLARQAADRVVDDPMLTATATADRATRYQLPQRLPA
jgi:hypothetical protein